MLFFTGQQYKICQHLLNVARVQKNGKTNCCVGVAFSYVFVDLFFFILILLVNNQY